MVDFLFCSAFGYNYIIPSGWVDARLTFFRKITCFACTYRHLESWALSIPYFDFHGRDQTVWVLWTNISPSLEHSRAQQTRLYIYHHVVQNITSVMRLWSVHVPPIEPVSRFSNTCQWPRCPIKSSSTNGHSQSRRVSVRFCPLPLQPHKGATAVSDQSGMRSCVHSSANLQLGKTTNQ